MDLNPYQGLKILSMGQIKERNNKGSEQAQLTNVQNQIWLDPTTYRSQNHAKNFLKLKILGWD